MNKKFFVSFAIILCVIFSFTVCLANDGEAGNVLGNAANGVRNFVGGVENTVENATRDVSNTSKNVTGTAENTMSGNTNIMTDNDNNDDNGLLTGGIMDNNDGEYTTTRVTTDNTLMGMTSNTWTWLILGIAAIAIIALVWYYSMQFNGKNNNYHNDD